MIDGDFEPFPKIARLKRGIVVTEKIDGTNAQIAIFHEPTGVATGSIRVGEYLVMAGSRKRWITSDDDNFGFARWVEENATQLVKLGEGRHFGEWWGSGIQRQYGLDEKRFSLFNVGRWTDADEFPECCSLTPVLYDGPWSDEAIEGCLRGLRFGGSVAAPGFTDPEGVVVFHKASRQLFKVTLENDDAPKGIADAA